MADILPLLVTALSIISALVGGGVWLMKANFRLSQQTLKAKQDVYTERFENLKSVIGQLQTELKATDEKLVDTMKRLHLTTCAINETKQTMVGYAEATEKRIKAFETMIQKINDDLIFVKSKTKGPTQ